MREDVLCGIFVKVSVNLLVEDLVGIVDVGDIAIVVQSSLSLSHGFMPPIGPEAIKCVHSANMLANNVEREHDEISDILVVKLAYDPIDSIIASFVIPVAQRVRVSVQVLQSANSSASTGEHLACMNGLDCLGVDGDDRSRSKTKRNLFLTVVRDQVGLELDRVFVVRRLGF